MRPEIFTCKWWRQWSKFMKDLETIKPWKTFGRSSVCLVFKRLLAMTFWIRILAFCVGKMFVKLAFSLCISLLGALRYIRRTQKCRGQNDSWLVFPCLINFDYSMSSSSLLWCRSLCTKILKFFVATFLHPKVEIGSVSKISILASSNSIAYSLLK